MKNFYTSINQNIQFEVDQTKKLSDFSIYFAWLSIKNQNHHFINTIHNLLNLEEFLND